MMSDPLPVHLTFIRKQRGDDEHGSKSFRPEFADQTSAERCVHEFKVLIFNCNRFGAQKKNKKLFPSLFSWTFFALRLSLSSQP